MKRPISRADAFHQAQQAAEAKEDEAQAASTESAPAAEPMTPEAARAVLAKVAQIREKIAQQLETLSELEHTVVVKVGVEQQFSRPRMGWPSIHLVRCQRCGNPLGLDSVEVAVEFDGRVWHKHNCKRTP